MAPPAERAAAARGSRSAGRCSAGRRFFGKTFLKLGNLGFEFKIPRLQLFHLGRRLTGIAFGLRFRRRTGFGDTLFRILQPLDQSDFLTDQFVEFLRLPREGVFAAS